MTETVTLDLDKAQAAYAAINALPNNDRPHHCLRLLLLSILHCRSDGSIGMTRLEIAATLGVRPDEVSLGMGVLERLGFITREREPEKGTRGLGSVVYRLTSNVGFVRPPDPVEDWRLQNAVHPAFTLHPA